MPVFDCDITKSPVFIESLRDCSYNLVDWVKKL